MRLRPPRPLRITRWAGKWTGAYGPRSTRCPGGSVASGQRCSEGGGWRDVAPRRHSSDDVQSFLGDGQCRCSLLGYDLPRAQKASAPHNATTVPTER